MLSFSCYANLSTVLFVLFLSCYLQSNGKVAAWTPLSDRLSGRFNDPQRGNGHSLRARLRRRTKAIPQDHLNSNGSNNKLDNSVGNKKSAFMVQQQQQQSTKKDRQDMMEFSRQPMDTLVGDYNTNTIPSELLDFVHCIVKAADDRKASDIVALHVAQVTTLSQVLILLSGNSRPQNQAIASAIVKNVAQEYNGLLPGGNGVPEGSAESGWMLLDYGSVMVHVMTPKSRLYYNVEGQWKNKGGKEIDLSNVLVPNSPVSADSSSSTMSQQQDEEDDPFWS